jgi:4-amino-4-deoxychorismate lyase
MTINANPEYLINGDKDSCLSPLDRGYAYGDGIFRTLVVNNGRPQHWARHYAKLLHDCNVLGIVCPSASVLQQDLKQLFADHSGMAVAKIIVTRGEGVRGYSMPPLAQPTRVVIKSVFPELSPDYFEQGVRLHQCQLRLGFQPALAGIKHLNRLENVMARAEWSDNTIADGLLLDTEDNVIECTMSNLFARYGRTLRTPDLTRCGVAGVTRQQVLENASELGYQVEITDISFNKLLDADEVLICNSIFGVWQVLEVGQQQWPQQALAAQLRKLLQE